MAESATACATRSATSRLVVACGVDGDIPNEGIVFVTDYIDSSDVAAKFSDGRRGAGKGTGLVGETQTEGYSITRGSGKCVASHSTENVV
jgi:hypothetical protein